MITEALTERPRAYKLTSYTVAFTAELHEVIAFVKGINAACDAKSLKNVHRYWICMTCRSTALEYPKYYRCYYSPRSAGSIVIEIQLSTDDITGHKYFKVEKSMQWPPNRTHGNASGGHKTRIAVTQAQLHPRC
jgi:hypothetical protein